MNSFFFPRYTSFSVMKVWPFKAYFGCLLACFLFANTVTLIRFVQVIIWKKVMEVNEDLAARCINRTVFAMSIVLGLLCHPEYKFYGILSVFESSEAEMPLAACKDDIDPLHQKWEQFAFQIKWIDDRCLTNYMIQNRGVRSRHLKSGHSPFCNGISPGQLALAWKKTWHYKKGKPCILHWDFGTLPISLKIWKYFF